MTGEVQVLWVLRMWACHGRLPGRREESERNGWKRRVGKKVEKTESMAY